jgi:hypothetical protein
VGADLNIWTWAQMDLNHRPHPYQGCALTELSYGPFRNGNPTCGDAPASSRLGALQAFRPSPITMSSFDREPTTWDLMSPSANKAMVGMLITP